MASISQFFPFSIQIIVNLPITYGLSLNCLHGIIVILVFLEHFVRKQSTVNPPVSAPFELALLGSAKFGNKPPPLPPSSSKRPLFLKQQRLSTVLITFNHSCGIFLQSFILLFAASLQYKKPVYFHLNWRNRTKRMPMRIYLHHWHGCGWNRNWYQIRYVRL